MKEFDLDRYMNLPVADIGKTTIKLLDHLQHEKPELQVAAVAMMFVLLKHQYDFSVTQTMEVARNMLERASFQSPELRAMQAYVGGEL